MSRRPKCTFSDCTNEVMLGPSTGRLLGVCKECFDKGRPFDEMGAWLNSVQKECPSCHKVVEVLCSEVDMEFICPYCGQTFLHRHMPEVK